MDDPQGKYRKYLNASSLGLNLAAGMILFSGLGYWLDQKTGGGRMWTLAGMFLGLFYCGYEVWKAVKASNNSTNSTDSKNE